MQPCGKETEQTHPSIAGERRKPVITRRGIDFNAREFFSATFHDAAC